MKKLMRWTLFNGLFAGCLVAGLVFDIKGALNIGIFLVWLSLLLSLTFFAEDLHKAFAAKKDWPSVPRWADSILDAAIVLLLVWHSRWFSGAAWVLHIMLAAYLYSEVDKIRNAKKSEKEPDE